MSTAGYVLGLDLGPPGEPTAIAVVQWDAPETAAKPAYVLRHLERFGITDHRGYPLFWLC